MSITTTNGAARLDVAHVKSLAAGRWPEILSAVAGIPSDSLDGKHHPCPACGGKDRFRLIDSVDGAVICNQCFRGGDGFAVVGWMRQCEFSQALRLVSEHLGCSPSGHNSEHRANIIEAVCRAKRMPVNAFRRFGATEAKRGKLAVARVPVFNEAGAPHSHFDLTPDGKGWFAKGKGSSGIFLPGRLPQAGEQWCLVEGVKDAAALDGLGLVVAGLPTKEMPAMFARLFRGVHVVIVPDRDQPGEEGARKTAARLAGHAATVRVATLPGELRESDGDDSRDVIAKFGPDVMRQVIVDARLWQADVDALPAGQQLQAGKSPLNFVRRKLRWPDLLRIEKHGCQDSVFVFLSDRGKVTIAANKLLRPKHVQEEIFASVHHLIYIKKDARDWAPIARAIADAAVIYTGVDDDETWRWVEEFAESLAGVANTNTEPDTWWRVAGIKRSIRGNDACMSFLTSDGSEIYLTIGDLQHTMRNRTLFISDKALSRRLITIGFIQMKQMDATIDDAKAEEIRTYAGEKTFVRHKKRLRPRYWRGPAERP